MQENYSHDVIKIMNTILQCEKDNINKAAKLIYQSIKNDGVLHVFATGHSHMVAEEMFYRSGGLVQIDPILKPFLMQHEGAISSTKYERLTGIAKIIYDGLELKDNEPFLIVSNSGINAVPVEMAELARENHHPVICITSLEASKQSIPRTNDQKHLFAVSDIVIDNHVPRGDGLIKRDYGKIGAVSTIVCSYIVQLLVIGIVECYEHSEKIPPVYQSANTLGGDEHNNNLIKEYKKRIKSLY